MFVVRRPFKNFGKTFVAGDIIDDPATIKRFKNKLAEGKILEVTEANKESYAEYFRLKFGVDIMPAEVSKAPEKVAKNDVAEPAAKPAKAVAKPVKAAVVK